MQQHADGTLVVSATDLVGFLECDHLVTLELERARDERERPFRNDPQLDLLRQRGFDHERRYIERLRAEGRTVTELEHGPLETPDDLRTAEAATLEAMRAGHDVIFQATFFDGRWRGHPDFLLRRDDRPSTLGSWSYDIADTKLAKRVKAGAIVQMSIYAQLLERLQGIPPEHISVVTGDAVAHPQRFEDYAAYVRAARARFEARVFGTDPPPVTYPEPVDHCRVCAWWQVCMDRRRADDHLSIVAGASRSQRRRLVDGAVPTLSALAQLGDEVRVPHVPPRILTRLRRQARLQATARVEGRPGYELLPPSPDDPGKGLAALPEPSPLDVFFDIEADPWAFDDGLEYLFGWAELGADGEPVYHALWAHDRAGEKAMLEAFVDLVLERRVRDPGMHVYHYGGYESGALKRLMQRHATREDEIDVLLRGRVLVNLWDHVVRQALQAGIESYSIKQLETFYMPVREGGITQAGFSVVAYEQWLESADPALLDELAAYNRDDCVSNLLLRDWLEARRVEALATHPEWYPDGVVPRPAPEDGAPAETIRAEQAETRAREERLRAGVPVDARERTPEEQARWLLAAVLDWHRREAKPQWWDHYRLVDAPVEDLVADAAALGELTFVEDLGRVARSTLRRYRFDPAQETKLDVGPVLALPPVGRETFGATIVALDPIDGLIDVKSTAAAAELRGLIPGKPFGTDVLRLALGRLADDVIERGLEASRFRSAVELLLRRPPRVHGGAEGGPLLAPDDSPLRAAVRLASRLDGTVLPIQGPPGTGKTYTAAQMILELAERGVPVGVTAQSHRVISNALEAVVRAAEVDGRQLRIVHKTDSDEVPPVPGIERLNDNDAVRDGLRAGTFQVVGGTAWLWSREEMEGIVGVLFVDEAGQYSLANTLAVAGAADSIVLLGDPNQLPQVSTGAHPEGAAASALEHIVGDAPTIAPDRGLLLATTHRLHPDVNAFISAAFYEGRLATLPATAVQDLAAGPPVGGTGIRHVPAIHVGASNRSREEATWIVEAIEALRGRRWRDSAGRERPIEVDDILIVAPYNAQVAEIGRRVEAKLGVRPNVGTVDRFQGREAPIAIYSMTTSTAEDAPRDLEFLYSGNRLNVAISRARGLAVLLANPALFRVSCRTPEQMRLVNAFCRYLEIALDQAAGPSGPGTGSSDDRAVGRQREIVELLELGL